MRDKNVRRAAKALYLSQGDDKNSKIAEKIGNPFVREVVKDQGRALILLEKLILPYGKDAYDEKEMYALLSRKLKKKGHRIQADDAEDDEQYSKEKERWAEARKLKVPDIFEVGMKITPGEEKTSPPAPTTPLRKMQKGSSYDDVPSLCETWRELRQHTRAIYRLLFG